MAIKITLKQKEDHHTRKDFLAACEEGRSKDAAQIAKAGITTRTFMSGIDALSASGAEDILQFC